MNAFQPVARLEDLPEDRGTQVDVEGVALVLVRQGDQVHAYQSTCPHAGAPLHRGTVCNGQLICPWHKASFALNDGRVCEPPALQGLKRYPVKIEAGQVWVAATALDSEPPAPIAADRTFVIIGAGAAGTAAALTLREAGFAGQLILIGAEPGAPIDRTGLSKFVLQGDQSPETATLIPDAHTLSRLGIQHLHGKVLRLDVRRQQIELIGNLRIHYDQALIATGGAPIPLQVPGSSLAGIHCLRTLSDVAAILHDVRPQRRAVIIGDSFIGLEAASALRKQQLDVEIVSHHETPFEHQMGQTLGRHLRALHERNGVVFHPRTEVECFIGGGHVEAVQLHDGTRLAADLVIIGTGVRPATGFIQGLTLNPDGGIPVDQHLRAAPNLYAAGDIACFPYAGTHLRIEHWRVAEQHGQLAARNMLGAGQPYADVPYFWTLQHGQRYEYLGHARDWDEELIEGDLEHDHFMALLVKNQQVAAAIGCHNDRLMARLSQRMKQPLPVQEARELLRAG